MGKNPKIRKYAFGYTLMDDKAIMIGSNYHHNNASFKVNTKPHI